MRERYSIEDVEQLEKQLQYSLQRVEPDKKFVSHLQTRLASPSATTIERRNSIAFGMLLVAFSLLSGVLTILIVRQFRSSAA